MAQIVHGSQYWDLGENILHPGQSYWMWWSDERFKEGTVIIKAQPSTSLGTHLYTTTLRTHPVYATSVPIPLGGGLSVTDYQIGVNITNDGQHPVKNFIITQTIIIP